MMRPSLPACFLAVLVSGLVARAGEVSSQGLLLVANKGDRTLSIVDAATERQVAVVSEEGDTGHEVAAAPDGQRAFVPIYGNSGVGRTGSDGQLIRVIDIGKRAIVGTIDFGKGVRPHRPLFNPKDGLLYVTTELEESVSIIDPSTLKVVGSIPTGRAESHMLALSGDGRRAYTANVKSGSISVLDLASRRLVTTIPVSTVIQRISISNDDRWLFTADQTKARLVVIDTSTNAVGPSIPLPGIAFGTAPTRDGRFLLVALTAINRVGMVDLGTLRLVRSLDVPKAPQEILARPDGAVAYVSCDASAQVAVIDLRAWRVERLIDVGRVADGLAWVSAN